MDNRYELRRLNIAYLKEVDGKIHFELNDDTEKYCILDKENDVAIDINTKIKYKYVISLMYFLSIEGKKSFSTTEKFATNGYLVSNLRKGKDVDENAKKIIELLKNGYEFPTESEYLENNIKFNTEELQKVKINHKIKKIKK